MPTRDESRKPLLSIIITCYNYENYVETAINSVLDQKCDFAELIVVDDGSRDNSWTKISRYGGAFIAARLQNGGALNACLHGLELSSGHFVYFLDADDFMHPGSLDVIRPHLREHVSKVQFKLTPIDAVGTVVGPDFPNLRHANSSDDLRRLIALKGSYLTPPTSGNVYRRDVYQNLGDLSYERGIDGIAYLLAPYLGDVVSIESPLASYRIHDRSLSAFSKITAASVEWSAQRFIRRLEHLRDLLSLKAIDHAVRPGRQFAYVIESEILALSLQNRRVSFGKFRQFARAIYTEEPSPKRELFIAMYSILSVVPHRLANELILFRINQSRYPWIRRLLKRITQLR